MQPVDAIIINDPTISPEELQVQLGATCKSLLKLNGKVMVQYVVEALRASKFCRRIVLVGPPELLSHPVSQQVDKAILETENWMDNLLRAVESLPDGQLLLMMTSDLPLVTEAMIDEFIQNFPPDAEVFFPFVRKESVLAEFPQRSWEFVRTREGEFTNCRLVLFRREAFERGRALLEQTFRFSVGQDAEKIVQLLGVGFLLKVKLGWVSVQEVEEHLSLLTGVTFRGFLCSHARMAFNVSHRQDLAWALVYLSNR